MSEESVADQISRLEQTIEQLRRTLHTERLRHIQEYSNLQAELVAMTKDRDRWKAGLEGIE